MTGRAEAPTGRGVCPCSPGRRGRSRGAGPGPGRCRCPAEEGVQECPGPGPDLSGLPEERAALGDAPHEAAESLGQGEEEAAAGWCQASRGASERLARSLVSDASGVRGGRWEPRPRMRHPPPRTPARLPCGRGEGCVEESRESAQHRDLPPRDLRTEGARGGLRAEGHEGGIRSTESVAQSSGECSPVLRRV